MGKFVCSICIIKERSTPNVLTQNFRREQHAVTRLPKVATLQRVLFNSAGSYNVFKHPKRAPLLHRACRISAARTRTGRDIQVQVHGATNPSGPGGQIHDCAGSRR